MLESIRISKTVLMLKKDKVNQFKQHILPGLISLIEREASFEAFNTLGDMVTFLLIYAEVTFKEKPNKKINVLGTLVEIMERILAKSSTYKSVISSDYKNDDLG